MITNRYRPLYPPRRKLLRNRERFRKVANASDVKAQYLAIHSVFWLARRANPDDAKKMTNASLHELREALQARLDVVADRAFYERDAAGHLAKLQAASAAVDRLAGELPAGADPMLRHFLERQSYVKALDWLDAELV
jgi:hypothetical protein